MKSLEKYLGNNSRIAETIPNYEYREEQIQMAQMVQKSIEYKKHLLVEAGCGVGKSFSYLIPFILHAQKNKHYRVAISTYTKTLQQQLIEKDIPLLRKALKTDIKAALCVGSENYLCLRKMERTLQNSLLETPQEAEQLRKLNSWIKHSKKGLKFNLDFPVSQNLWSDICRYPDMCHEKKCLFFKRCFYYKAKKRQSKANLLIINHHLLFNDINSGGMILPKYEAIVFDEAQNLEDVASNMLGLRVSYSGIKYLMSRIHKSNSSRCLLSRYRSQIKKDSRTEIIGAVNAVRKAADDFFTQIFNMYKTKSSSYKIEEPGLFENPLSMPLSMLSDILYGVSDRLKDEEASREFKSYAKRCSSTSDELYAILQLKLENYVSYLTIKVRQGRLYCSFNSTPIEPAGLLKKLVFDKFAPIVITSATLTVKEKFDFIKERLGVENPEVSLLHSPYNFREKALMYVPHDIPDPSYDFGNYEKEVEERSSRILEITEGRTFILFTSYQMLSKMAVNLTDRFPDIRFLVHGEEPREKLIKDFKNNPNSVLLGTSTFWQGIDMPGRLLECVIITKLPFAAPNDPINEARIEKIRKRGNNPFLSYQVPTATLQFRQGFGRLIRHRDDFGIIAVLDPRVSTRKYGKYFLQSLPRCQFVKDLGELEEKYTCMTPECKKN